MVTSQSPPEVLWGQRGEFICFVDAGITLQQFAMAGKNEPLDTLVHYLDNIKGLSRELSSDPIVLLAIFANEQLVLVINHTADGISTCVVLGDPKKAFSVYEVDSQVPGLFYVNLRVAIDQSNYFVDDAFSGLTFKQAELLDIKLNQYLKNYWFQSEGFFLRFFIDFFWETNIITKIFFYY